MTVARATQNLLEHYSASAGAYDEMESAPASLRPHWHDFMQSLKGLGREELASRWENGRRMLREHGVTYNVYGDPQGMERPWGLDLVPLLIQAEDWMRIEPGLLQRSRLFNAILADLYSGRQRLLRDGFLPPELVYANPGFHRSCRGIIPAGQVHLHLHACDLGRAANGQWWVLADRTQTPSGAGYALENRAVIARILPEDIRKCRAQRLSSFFRLERQMLYNLAPTGCENPSVVLLTPGPHNETYFEHAFLARHLGFPLVEGADLTVRNRRVFLMTLEGLQPVDVILRRVDDSFSDPLELRSESVLGVPGLLEATRAGNVTLANALGAGLIESPAFLAFLPSLCRHLLGEKLLLPSVATWWCGQAKELRYVLEHLQDLVVKSAFGPPNRQPWLAGRLSAAERAKLVRAIRARPQDFVGQERVVLSRAPVWVNNRFEARSVVVRAYAANGRDSAAVLPGGLTRVSRTAEDPVVSMQSGGGCKDTWVLAGPVATRNEPAVVMENRPAIERAFSGLPSRAADNLFWLARYTERLEQELRVLRCVLGRLADEAPGDGWPELAALAELVRNLNLLPSPSDAPANPGELEQQALEFLYQPGLAGGVRDLLERIRFLVSTVRDRFSGDTWRILGRLEMDARARPNRLRLAQALALIHNLVLDLAAFSGMEMENMTRGHGWRFLDLGRRLERGLSVVRLLRSTAGSLPKPNALLEPILEIADSGMTYRRRYFAEPRLPGVLELLLHDASNPRSLAFQLDVLREHTRELAVAGNGQGSKDGPARLTALGSTLSGANLEALAADCGRGHREPLRDFLAWCTGELTSFSDELCGQYFNHTVPRAN